MAHITGVLVPTLWIRCDPGSNSWNQLIDSDDDLEDVTRCPCRRGRVVCWSPLKGGDDLTLKGGDVGFSKVVFVDFLFFGTLPETNSKRT